MDSGRISGTGFLARENSRRRRRKMFSQATVPQDEIISLLELLK